MSTTHVLILDPKPLDSLIVPLLQCFLNMQKGAIQGLICFKSIPGPLSKVALIYIKMQCSFIEPKPQKKNLIGQ
jgi:hypothetical protein